MKRRAKATNVYPFGQNACTFAAAMKWGSYVPELNVAEFINVMNNGYTGSIHASAIVACNAQNLDRSVSLTLTDEQREIAELQLAEMAYRRQPYYGLHATVPDRVIAEGQRFRLERHQVYKDLITAATRICSMGSCKALQFDDLCLRVAWPNRFPESKATDFPQGVDVFIRADSGLCLDRALAFRWEIAVRLIMRKRGIVTVPFDMRDAWYFVENGITGLPFKFSRFSAPMEIFGASAVLGTNMPHIFPLSKTASTNATIIWAQKRRGHYPQGDGCPQSALYASGYDMIERIYPGISEPMVIGPWWRRLPRILKKCTAGFECVFDQDSDDLAQHTPPGRSNLCIPLLADTGCSRPKRRATRVRRAKTTR